MRIRMQMQKRMPIRLRIQGFEDQKLRKKTENKIDIFEIENYNLLIPRPP